QKPNLLSADLSLPWLSNDLLREENPLFKLNLSIVGTPVQFEISRPDLIPRLGSCGILRNNSIFGCNYLNEAGRETRIGMSVKRFPGGLGFSLKLFLGVY
ncbi:MAG TPA: hypothetical protein VFW62_04350, partial [bacterium]|nr:hypothetical protein [bacterium]